MSNPVSARVIAAGNTLMELSQTGGWSRTGNFKERMTAKEQKKEHPIGVQPPPDAWSGPRAAWV